jgi:hypothetical protein
MHPLYKPLPATLEALPNVSDFRLVPILMNADEALGHSIASPLLFALVQKTYRQSYAEWGVQAGLTLAQYLDREKQLDETEFVLRRKWTWVLLKKEDWERVHGVLQGSEEGWLTTNDFRDIPILAQCETFVRPCLVHGKYPIIL